MKILIMYTTTHGTTEKCVMKLQQHLNGEVEVVNVKKSKPLELDRYDTIIVGGSIHAGQIQKRIKRFCEEKLGLLKKKRIGLFICCMEEGKTAKQQRENAFPGDLINHAVATAIFGGEFNFEKMNFLQKAIVKKVAKVDNTISKIDENSIIEFAKNVVKQP